MNGIYIANMEMPKDEEILCINIYPDGKVCINLDLDCKQVATAVPVPDHKGPLVDALEVINTFPEEFIFTNYQAKALTNYIIPADREE